MSHRTVPGAGPGVTMTQLQVMERTARSVAGAYARKLPWLGDDELVQVAWVEMLKAARTYDPESGKEFGVYCYVVARNAVVTAVLKQASPVGGGSHRRTVHAQLRAEPTHAEPTAAGAEVERAEVSAQNAVPTPEAAVTEAEFARRVQDRLKALVGERGVPFAVGVFAGEYAAGEIAAAHGVPVREVYALRTKVRRILEDDAALYALWRERTKGP